MTVMCIQLRNWFVQVADAPYLPKQITKESAINARSNIALDLVMHQIDHYDFWMETHGLSTPPQNLKLTMPPPPRKKASRREERDSSPDYQQSPIGSLHFLSEYESDGAVGFHHGQAPKSHSRTQKNITRITQHQPHQQNFWVQIDILPPHTSGVKIPNQQLQNLTIGSTTSSQPLFQSTQQPLLTQSPPQSSPTSPSQSSSHFVSQQEPSTPPPSHPPMKDWLASPSKSPVLIRKAQNSPEQRVNVTDLLRINGSQPRFLTIDPSKLPGPHVMQYHANQNAHNSCWLDSGEMEALYAISLYDQFFWHKDSSEPLLEPVADRISDLCRCFAARSLVHCYAPTSIQPKLLQLIRDGYMNCLIKPDDNPVITADERGNISSPFVSQGKFQVHTYLIA
jgi:hypothetical protein